jgi:hypothetical protein
MANELTPTPPTQAIMGMAQQLVLSPHTQDELDAAGGGGTDRPTSGQVYPRGNQ